MESRNSLHNMKLNEVIAWYQKKIGTYDKQQWEKTVEQRILNSFTGLTLKNAKLKTECIDVDLVRGSSFPKAKPKQSLLTVIRLAILRYLFLPLYAKWWTAHTSPKHFLIFLMLYMGQLLNWAIYILNVQKSDKNTEHIVSNSELIIPMILSFILCLIHSLIVATNSISSPKSKSKHVFNKNNNTREKIRRRKKINRNLFHTNVNESSELTTHFKINKKSNDLILNLDSNYQSVESSNSSKVVKIGNDENNDIFSQQVVIHNYDIDVSVNEVQNVNNLQINEDCCNSNINKKRNVNWDSPIHNYVNETFFINSNCNKSELNTPINNDEINQQPDLMNHSKINDSIELHNNPSDIQNDGNNIQHIVEPSIEDDGFESLNGKSSSGEENRPKIIRNCNRESTNSSKNETISNTDNNTHVIQSKNQLRKRIIFGKNRLSSNSSYNSSNNNNNSDLNVMNDNDNDDDDDELSDKEMFKSGFDKLNKRYSIPIIRNCRNNSSESELDSKNVKPLSTKLLNKNETLIKKISSTRRSNESSDIDEEGDDEETGTNPPSVGRSTYKKGCSTSTAEWLGVTTNSEECSCSSEPNSDFKEDSDDFNDHEYAPTVLLNSHGSNDIINCTIWDRNDPKKAEMSVLDISSCIIEKVEAMPESYDYIYIGVVFTIILSLIPSFCRICEAAVNWDTTTEISYFDVPFLLWEKTSCSIPVLINLAFGKENWEKSVLLLGFVQRFLLTFLLFFLFAVAERSFKQRFLYAKLFSHLTSSRRARKSDLPHFRLNKVRNIKTWLSVRSYLKRRGPQRSVDVIVSTAFSIALLLLGFLSVECLKDSVHMHSQINLEALLWSGALGIYLLRFMTLGNNINKKYRSISVLITEQINLYLQIEQKPKKKDELMVANSVLKLAADLLKELESPFKISGLSANPYLYTTVKVVILSAFSGVLSEMLGFKLKLHKIKIK